MSLIYTQNTIALQDAEFNSSVNRAALQAGSVQFKLVLATLEQNLLNRIRLADSDEKNSVETADFGVTNFYPEIPLKPDNQTWRRLDITRGYISAGDLSNAKLWQIMHPEALSLFNDANRLDDQVVANSSFFTQNQHMLALQQKVNAENQTDAQLPEADSDIENMLEAPNSTTNSLHLEQDPTMLFELLNQLSATSALPSATTEQNRATQAA